VVLLHQVRQSLLLASSRYLFILRTDHDSLPIGAVSIAVIVFILQIPSQPHREKQSILERIKELDLIGASILIPAIICLLLALQWGGATYPWNSSRVIGLFVGFGVLILIFIYTQIKLGDRATLPPRILAQRTVAAASVYSIMFAAGFFVLVFYLPIYFQSIKNVSATRSGIEVLPLMLATVLSSIVTGGLITVFGYYTPFVVVSAVIFAIGAGLISTITVDTPFARWFGYQVFTGAGVGVGFQVPLIAVQTVLELEDIPVGTAAVIFFQTLGGALFVSVGQTVFQNGVIKGTREFIPGLDPHFLLEAGATEIRNLLAMANMSDKLPQALQAYMVGLTDVFRVSVAATAAGGVAAFFIEWRSVKDEEAKKKKEAVEELGIV